MKARILRKNRKQGQIPGTLEAPKGAFSTTIRVMAYDTESLEEEAVRSLDQIDALRKKFPMIWVDVAGLADTALIDDLGKRFGLHRLALEDVLHIPQRAKAEEYDESFYLVLRMLEREEGQPTLDQLSMFWGENFVITFQERPGDSFGPVRDRLRKGARRVKMVYPDYLAYALLDAVIDGFFPLLEQYGDNLDTLEETVLDDASAAVMRSLHATKRELHTLRLCLWPMREAVAKLRPGSPFVREEMQVYLRDCHDHIVQILDIIENYRERMSALNDLYLSSISNRLNEVMKVLTIIATIFMPLSFIASLYGMNFDTSYPLNMPELHSPYGYVSVLIFMFVLATSMLFYFWRQGWMRGIQKK